MTLRLALRSAEASRPLMLLLAACYISALAPAQSAFGADKPKLSFVDFEKSAIGQVLEARLLAKPGYEWVDRGNLDQLIREQKIEALFSATGVGDRSVFGRLLKADILVLLRKSVLPADESASPPEPAKSQMELVVCETSRGLRLASHRCLVPDAGGETKTVDRLENWVLAAVRPERRNAAEICAVPPFISNDLTFTEDYLKQAYANIVEQTVLANTSFVLVELAEAESLAREAAIGGDIALRRALPLYLLGDYRHEGSGPLRRVSINLRLMRGDRQLAAGNENNLPAAAATAALHRLTANLLKNVSRQDGPVFRPDVEARQLAERAREFMQLGNIDEAMPLLEAALLLKPDDHDIRRDAVIVDGQMGSRYFYHRNDTRIALPAIRNYRRGLQHLETWLAANATVPQNELGRNFVMDFPLSLFVGNAPQSQEVKPYHDELLKDVYETLLRITRLRARQNAPDAFRFLTLATSHLPSRERYRVIGEMVLELQDLPGAESRTAQFVQGWFTINRLNDDGGADLLAEFANARSPDVRRVSELLKTSLADANAAEAAKRPRTVEETFAGEPKLPMGPTQVVFNVLSFDSESDDRKFTSIDGCIPAGSNTDVLWIGKGLYVMKQPGRLRKVWEATDLNDRFNIVSKGGQYSGAYVAYDGRYVWATISRHLQPPLLLVLDPINETVQQVTAEHGLPIVATDDVAKDGTRQYLAVAAVEPGRACVVGSFGRTWIAMVRLDSARQPKVEVIHECRHVADPASDTQWQKSDVAFDPTYAFTLSDSKTGEKRIFMGRGNHNHHFNYHPLLIDPTRKTVTVFTEKLTQLQSADRLAAYDGSMFLLDFDFAAGRDIYFARIGAPDWKREPLLHHVPQGLVVVFGNQIHIIGKRWWSGSYPDGPLFVAAAEVPWHFTNFWFYPNQNSNPEFGLKLPPGKNRLEAIFTSNHYGAIVRTASMDKGTPIIQQVKVVSRQ